MSFGNTAKNPKGGVTSDHVNTQDLTSISNPINDDAIVSALKDRFETGRIYTRIGSSIITVVNPTQASAVHGEASASESKSKQYAEWAKDTSSTKADLPVHVFDLATSVFEHMLRDQQDQSVLFLGESGSGKSETRKQFVRQLCALSKSANKKSRVISCVLKSETILDAFGNSSTVDNENSSRSGKYIEYQFDQKGKLVGAKFLDFILEKHRVVSPPKSERNFNIFYQLLSGCTPQERQAWKLADPAHFLYLSGGQRLGSTSQRQAQDAAAFLKLKADLKSVGVGIRQQTALFQTLAAILHLGNLIFFDDPNRVGEACEVRNHDVLAIVSELLGVLPVNLEYALTYKSKVIKKERCTVYLTAADAVKQRDSLAEALYSLIFTWLVEHLNSRLDNENSSTFVGVVDVSGFQDYEYNSFDQLLYNYANEHFQNFAFRRIFGEKFSDLQKDGIHISRAFTAPDNSAPLQLLAGSENSLLSLINKESLAPSKNPDMSLMDSIADKLSSNPCLVSTSKGSNSFSIKHQAGIVQYKVDGFIEKNIDSLSFDFVSLFLGNGADIIPTSNMFIRSIFSTKAVSKEYHPSHAGVLAGVDFNKSTLRHPSMKRRASSGTPGTAKPPGTIAEGLEVSLKEISDTMNETVPWFVFCLKPNEDLGDNQFDARTIKGQISYMSFTPLVQASKTSDFTASYSFDDFKTKYRSIIEPMNLDLSFGSRQLCHQFVSSSNWTSSEMAIGRTQVYLSEGAWRSLEDELRTIEAVLKAESKQAERSKRSSMNPRQSFAVTDVDSNYSSDGGYDDEGSNYSGADVESHFGSEFKSEYMPANRARTMGGNDVESGQAVANLGEAKVDPIPDSTLAKPQKKKMSSARCKWVCITWCLTWWIPSFCLSICKMKRPDIRMAWREKLAICILIFFMCAFFLFFIIGLGMIICPRQNVYTSFELAGKNSYTDMWVSAYGRVFRINEVVNNHVSAYGQQAYDFSTYAGQDVSKYFYKAQAFARYCDLPPPQPDWDNLSGNRPIMNTTTYPYHHAIDPSSNQSRLYLEYMNQYAVSRLAWSLSYVQSTRSSARKYVYVDLFRFF
jgi:chitin synthase